MAGIQFKIVSVLVVVVLQCFSIRGFFIVGRYSVNAIIPWYERLNTWVSWRNPHNITDPCRQPASELSNAAIIVIEITDTQSIFNAKPAATMWRSVVERRIMFKPSIFIMILQGIDKRLNTYLMFWFDGKREISREVVSFFSKLIENYPFTSDVPDRVKPVFMPIDFSEVK